MTFSRFLLHFAKSKLQDENQYPSQISQQQSKKSSFDKSKKILLYLVIGGILVTIIIVQCSIPATTGIPISYFSNG